MEQASDLVRWAAWESDLPPRGRGGTVSAGAGPLALVTPTRVRTGEAAKGRGCCLNSPRPPSSSRTRTRMLHVQAGDSVDMSPSGAWQHAHSHTPQPEGRPALSTPSLWASFSPGALATREWMVTPGRGPDPNLTLRSLLTRCPGAAEFGGVSWAAATVAHDLQPVP